LGEIGLTTLCKALHTNLGLRHLDLRHAGLTGAESGKIIGEMLLNNDRLTHLELSWNPLGPAGGQALLDKLHVNTTLFDCQLTGCGIADETLLSIAQLLHRNRKAKGADSLAGNFQANQANAPRCPNALATGIGGDFAESQFIECTGDGTNRVVQGQAEEEKIPKSEHAPARYTSVVISSEATNEMMMRLNKFMGNPKTSSKDAALASEMYSYMDSAQKDLILDRDQVEHVHRHLTALSSGFRDRELRARDTLASGQDELLESKREILSIRGIMERRSEDLGLLRDQNSVMQRDKIEDENQATEDEAHNKNKLAEIMAEKRELEKRLWSLQEKCQKQEAENVEMRKKASRLRQGVTLLHQPGRAGPFPESFP